MSRRSPPRPTPGSSWALPAARWTEKDLHVAFARLECASHVQIGIGDDAALLAPFRGGVVATVDQVTEGVDFRCHWARPADVGRKAVGSALSDLAAMGARPKALLLAMSLTGAESKRSVLALVRAAAAYGGSFGAPVVGGDLTRIDGPLSVSVTALGEQSGPITRVGTASLGDRIVVTGSLGGAAAALRVFELGDRPTGRVRDRQLRPIPRFDASRVLAPQVSAMTDISDGLLLDAAALAGPGATVDIDPACLPIDRATRVTAQRYDFDLHDLALYGGEDYELVASVAPSRLATLRTACARAGVAVSEIGQVIRGSRPKVGGQATSRLQRGFDHFARV